MKSRLRKLGRVVIALILICAVAIAIALFSMAGEDKKHEKFYSTGKSVNSFLSAYNHALKHASLDNDPSTLLSFYSDSYVSPGRGRWVMQREQDAGGAACYRFVADGNGDFTRDDLRAELAGYLGGLSAIEDNKLKIDMIEHVDLERSVVLTVKFILDGRDLRGALFQDRHFYRWYLVNEDSSARTYDWKIVRDELVEGVRVAGDG